MGKRESPKPQATYAVLPSQLGLPLDARGLLPLEDARRRVRAATVFDRGQSHAVPGQAFAPTDADRLWMALLSLETAEEFTREATRLEWRHPPLRGWNNVDAWLRYGEGALPWVEHMLAMPSLHFVVRGSLEGMLVACGPVAARTVVRVKRAGDADPDQLGLVDAWLRAHGDAAWKALAELAVAGDAEAVRALEALARRAPRRAATGVRKAIGKKAADALLGAKQTLQASTILRALDAAAAADVGARVPWPTIRASAGHFEFHAMRVVAVRAARGDDWGILIEVVQGDVLDPDARWPATIQRYVYGSRVEPGGRYLTDARPLPTISAPVDRALAEQHDLRPGWSITGQVEDWSSVLAIRATLALAKDTIWTDPTPLVTEHLNVRSPIVVASSDALEHVDGTMFGKDALRRPPSESVAYRSIATAIVERSDAPFTPGTVTTDWRAWAQVQQAFAWPPS